MEATTTLCKTYLVTCPQCSQEFIVCIPNDTVAGYLLSTGGLCGGSLSYSEGDDHLTCNNCQTQFKMLGVARS